MKSPIFGGFFFIWYSCLRTYHSAKGAKASAVLYSIVETAKANRLDVFKYFELLLTVLPSMGFLTNPDILEELLPWNESVQKICKAI